MSAQAETLDTSVVPASAAPSAPVTGWRRFVADCLLVSGASVVCQVLGTVTSLVLRMCVDPAQMGVWQAVKMLLGYANYANLGVSKGAAREFTIARGRGDTSAAEHGLNLAFTVNTLTSLAYAAVLVAAGVWIALSGGGAWSGAWAVGMIVAGALAVLQRHVTFQVTILRAAQQFGVTSQLSVLEAALTLAVCGLATWRWGLAGLYASTAAVMAASLVYVERHRASRLAWAWHWAEIRRLVAIGAPILLAGTVSSLFRSLDKLMILACMSDREFQLGCYSLALMVATAVYGLGNTLSLVLLPRYGEKYGQSGSRRDVAMLAARSSEFLGAALGLVAAVAAVAAPPLLARLLPDYQPGLAPLLWLLPGTVAIALALPPSQYLVAVEREARALWTVVAATVLAAVGNYAALKAGWGLSGVAASTAASYLVYMALSVAVSFWSELEVRERVRFVAMHALAIAPASSTAIALELAWSGSDASWPAAAAKVVVVVAVWGASAASAWRLGGWDSAFRQDVGWAKRSAGPPSFGLVSEAGPKNGGPALRLAHPTGSTGLFDEVPRQGDEPHLD